MRATPSQSASSPARIASFPLNLVVVEFEIEVSHTRVTAINQDQLEDVRLVDVAGIVSDTGPVHAKRIVPANRARAVRHQWAVACVHISEARCDDRWNPATCDTKWGKGGEGRAERDVAVVVDVCLRVRRAKEVGRESEVDQAGRSVVVCWKVVRGKAWVGSDSLSSDRRRKRTQRQCTGAKGQLAA